MYAGFPVSKNGIEKNGIDGLNNLFYFITLFYFKYLHIGNSKFEKGSFMMKKPLQVEMITCGPLAM